MLFKRAVDISLPPAILIGGGANALSVARSLRQHCIRVLSLGNPDSAVRFSRFCEWIPLSGRGDIQEKWLQWLTGRDGKQYRGAVIIPCGDDGLEFVVRHRSVLSSDFLVYEANDKVVAAMLDKAETHALAKKADVPAPEVWIVNTRDDIVTILDRIQFPCGLKPRVSHEFKKYFKEKLFVANTADELLSAWQKVEPFKQEMIVTELVPGGDKGYCSYYSYLDEKGQPLFHFTKVKLRQYPSGFGIGTFHQTDWNPEVASLGLKFFQGIGLRGLACVEFKRDQRDGLLKLIECNHRFTEPNELMVRAGLDLPLLVYNRLTKRPLPHLDSYRRGLCLVKPWEDVKAFYSLHAKGELAWSEWLRSFSGPVCFLYFKWWDPMPWFVLFQSFWLKHLKRILHKRTKSISNVSASEALIAKASG